MGSGHESGGMRLLPLGADCDRKLSQYRAALDAGGDSAVIAGWVTRAQAERVRHVAARRNAAAPARR